MKLIQSFLFIFVVSMSNVAYANTENITLEQGFALMAQCYELVKNLAELPLEVTQNIDLTCNLCNEKTLIGYFAGVLVARGYSEKIIELKSLMRKHGLTADELKQFFIATANATQEPCRPCQDFKGWR